MHDDAVQIDVLSRFAVRRDGREVPPADFGGRLVRRLVRVLAVQRGRVVTRDALIEALWGEQAPADPAANLNVLVNRARRALGDAELIQTVAGGYLLRDGAGVVVDAEVFETRVREARADLDAGDAGRALAGSEAALAQWSGGEPLAEDAYDDWATPHRERLRRARQEALEVGAEAALASGATRRAAALAQEAVAEQPLREAAHLLLVRALAAGGDHAAALTAYDRLRRALAEELGIDPSPAAAQLQQRLLRGEPVGATAVARPTPPRFVGRDGELATLVRVVRRGEVALLAGRAGSGKSRLLAELTARTPGTVLHARAVLPERETPWSLARALLQAAVDHGVDIEALVPGRTAAALADLLPGLDAAGTAPLEPRTWRALVLQGGVRVLEAAGAAVLVVDDLQWADATSLDLLALHAARRESGAIVLAFRPQEVPAASRFLAEVKATTRAQDVSLAPLPQGAVAELVASEDVAAVLAAHTDGTPFAVLEAVRELDEAGVLAADAAGRWRPTTADAADLARAAALAGQQRALWVRVERLGAPERELLGLLALLGRPATPALLGAATTHDVLEALGGLGQAELVRHDGPAFAPAHDLVSETVRDRLDPVERARLHARLAGALRAAEAPAEELARHLQGAGDLQAAADAYVAAARDRLDRFADPEAEQLAHEGLAASPHREARAALLEVRAEVRARRGDYGDAQTDLGDALAVTTEGAARSRLLTRMAGLVSGADDLLRARDLAQLALAEAGDDLGARARALYQSALVEMNLESPEVANARYDEALQLFEQLGDAAGVADIHDARAMVRFMGGDVTGGVEAFDRVARLFADSGNLLRVVTPRTVGGHGKGFLGRPEEGLHDIEAALQLARTLGYAEGEALSLWQYSETLLHAGRPREALEAAEAAVATARRIGHRGWLAPSLLALALAQRAVGDAAAAETTCREALPTSRNLPLFICWAHARLASLLIARGALEEAASHVAEALATGPGLTQYEARLAQCELAVARGDPDANELLGHAEELAVKGGHLISATRLSELRGG